MKTRKGFVSNSSTSSFVLIGYDITDLCEKERKRVSHEGILRRNPLWNDIKKKFDALMADDWDEDDAWQELYWEYGGNIEIIDHEENGAPRGRILIGIKLYDDDSMDVSIDKEKIDDALKQLHDAVDLPDHLHWTIRCATRMC